MKLDTKAQLELLRSMIKEELGDCDSNLWPKLCTLRSTPSGYQKVEDTIIRLVATEGMPIGSAIAYLEQELAHQDAS